MVASEVDGSPSQPAIQALAQVDMHRLLRDPDGLPELMGEFDCTEASQIVDYLAVQLSSATEIDAIGIIDHMALLCTDADEKHTQSSMSCLYRSVAAFVADCIQFVDGADVQIVLVDFISTASLAAGCELLLKIGHGHRTACASRRVDVDRGVRYVNDAMAGAPAMEVWRHRVKRAMASGYVMAESEVFLFARGLTRFSVGAIGAGAAAASSGQRQTGWGAPPADLMTTAQRAG
jgi:hypothetical protein